MSAPKSTPKEVVDCSVNSRCRLIVKSILRFGTWKKSFCIREEGPLRFLVCGAHRRATSNLRRALLLAAAASRLLALVRLLIILHPRIRLLQASTHTSARRVVHGLRVFFNPAYSAPKVYVPRIFSNGRHQVTATESFQSMASYYPTWASRMNVHLRTTGLFTAGHGNRGYVVKSKFSRLSHNSRTCIQ